MYFFQLSEVFESEIDPVMKNLGFCCGRKYVFCPQVLICYGKQLCTVPVNATYYSYQNRYEYLFWTNSIEIKTKLIQYSTSSDYNHDPQEWNYFKRCSL